MIEWVFGFGSLVDAGALASWLGRGPFEANEAVLCRLIDHRRSWNVARNNSVIREGRPYYVDSRTGRRANVFVATVNIRQAPGETVNGLAVRVAPAELDRLDRREFNYDRVDATNRIDRPLRGNVWVYRGSAAARARFRAGRAANNAVVARRYHEIVEAAFASHGCDYLAEYRATTDPPDAPFADLYRTDWPPP